jgi:YidC/Oxa1 family membrane protein insertase
MIGYLSSKIMLPILDFFYGIVPSYGLAIVALTLVIRFALYPVSAGQIRNMRRMKVAQPAMQKRQQEVKERYKDDPTKMQEEQAKIIQEFGNPLAGCLPLLLQMPILFALFATLRGSPFADIKYSVNVKVLPQDKIEQVDVQPFLTKPQNIYVDEGVHYSVAAIVPAGNRLAVGDSTEVELQTATGKPFSEVLNDYPDSEIRPTWSVIRGEDRVALDAQGHLKALQPGDATLQGSVPGIAAQKGFLFIKALGRVGALEGDLMTETADGGTRFNSEAIHWDILLMVIGFGVSLYVNQLFSGQSGSDQGQQQAIQKYMPVMFSGMFLFFPLPAGVLLYMLIANVFQTVQSFFLAREPLPENLQKIVDEEQRKAAKASSSMKSAKPGEEGRKPLPFEPEYSKNTDT